MPGGIGLAERIYELAPTLLERTLASIRGCSCEDGCPACVGPSEGLAGRRAAAITLLERMRA
jgi:DEAD/DEAH box helicase domain-containing protein